MRAGINIPELSLYRIFFCPAHTNFLCPVYPGLTTLSIAALNDRRSVVMAPFVHGSRSRAPGHWAVGFVNSVLLPKQSSVGYLLF
jgi:hypothetical protein